MFSTFTGNSRRPRNVNLSGQAGNPFANTAWSPSSASNATKTVSDAQVEREKRQAERQRQKAAAKIQRTWRSHRVREEVADSRRAAFDQLYQSSNTIDADARAAVSLPLLLSFFRPQRPDDVPRITLFAEDCNSADLASVCSGVHPSRLRRLVEQLTKALESSGSASDRDDSTAFVLLNLITRLVQFEPTTISTSLNTYFIALAHLCSGKFAANVQSEAWAHSVLGSLTTVLEKGQIAAYEALAFCFLTSDHLVTFECNIPAFSKCIQVNELAKAISRGYPTLGKGSDKDRLLWLLAHFIDLSQGHPSSSSEFIRLDTLSTQVSALSSEISLRFRTGLLSEDAVDSSGDASLGSFEPYISRQLMSLVAPEGISRLVSDFSSSLGGSSNQDLGGTTLFAGYSLALLQAFANNADGTRMRLFLEQVPTSTGDIPLVVFLWRMMRQTTVFSKLRNETERPAGVLKRYLQRGPQTDTSEEEEWRIILLFLDMFIFVMRLSDDEDFFSNTEESLLQTNQSTSRIRACSLTKAELQDLMLFLKHTGFSLYYEAQELSRHVLTDMNTHMGPRDGGRKLSALSNAPSSKLDLESLRTIISTALKMLYERNSRKQFLPSYLWLMTHKLETEGFMAAVVHEEQRQMEEQEAEDSDEDASGGPSGMDIDSNLTTAGQRLSHHARLELLRAQQRLSTKEQLQAQLRPKLEILQHMPFAIPFETRLKIFRQFVILDRHGRRGGGDGFFGPQFARHQANIRRDEIFEDAYKEFYKIGDGLRDTIQITFVDQFDNPEAGIDGGGVTKEFLTSITSQAFGSQGPTSMFVSNEQGLLYPNPAAMGVLRESLRRRGLVETDSEWSEAIHDLLKRYEFLGRIVGKCLYEGILVDLVFAGFFLLKWPSAGPGEENRYKGSINDLKDMDEGLYNGMLRLKNFQGDVSELGIDFTIADQISGPGEAFKTATKNLVLNGDQVAVTNDNRLLYISYVARHRLVVQPAAQTNAFLHGLRSIIRPTWLSMFNQSELQRLVGGDSTPIDLDDLRRNTVYSGLYEIGDDNQEHDTIKLFWNVLEKFTDAQRRDLLKYVSSTPRAPLLGFSQLNPKFSIRDGGHDENRLPSTSTCVNLLKLPRYSKESTLREKLLYAIQSGAGFDLS